MSVVRDSLSHRAGSLSGRDPPEGAAVPLDPAQSGKRHVVRVDEEVLVGGPAEQTAAAEDRSLRVVIPGRPPSRVAELQAVVEGIAGAEQPLATAFQHERHMTRRMARGVDGADVGENLLAGLERA